MADNKELNRTYVELKFGEIKQRVPQFVELNRTYVELKSLGSWR